MHRELTGLHVDDIDDLPERDLESVRMRRGIEAPRSTIIVRTGRTPDLLVTFEPPMPPLADDGRTVDRLAFGSESIQRREPNGVVDPAPRVISEVALDPPRSDGVPPP